MRKPMVESGAVARKSIFPVSEKIGENENLTSFTSFISVSKDKTIEWCFGGFGYHCVKHRATVKCSDTSKASFAKWGFTYIKRE